MRDEKGVDFKTLCVAIGDPHQQHIERLEQVRPHRLVEIEHFFTTYKLLEDKEVDVVGWREREEALRILAARTASATRAEHGCLSRRAACSWRCRCRRRRSRPPPR